MSLAAPEARPLPGPIRRGLRRVDRRLRALGALRGLGTLALVLAAGALAGMAADVAFVLPNAARWALWAAWAGAGAAALAWCVLRPLARRVAWADLAAVAERAEPALGERLTSSVELLAGRPHGSPDLIAALADDAAARAGSLDARRALPARAAWNRAALGALAVALVVLPAAARPDPFAAILARFVAPWRDVARVGRFLVDVRPGDRVVGIGSDLPVAAQVRPRYGRADAPAAAWLEWTDIEGKARRVRMAPESDDPSPTRAFAATLPRVRGSLSYRVTAGGSSSRWHRINAVEPPAVAAIVATIEPPSYTKRPRSVAADPARIEAWEGSRVTLRVTPSKPVRRLGVDWPRAASGKGAPPARRSVALTPADDGRGWSATLAADASGPYSFELWDEHEINNRPGPPRRLVVRPDAPPTVALGGPDGMLTAKPDDVLLVEVAARDDLEVASVELHYAVARAGSAAPPEAGHVAATLPGVGTPRARGEAALGLKELGLKPGDGLTYRVRVADSRPAPRGPNVAWSPIRALTIAAQAEPLASARDAAERADLKAKLEALQRANAANRKETEALRYAADAAQRGNGPWDKARDEALARREAEARDLGSKLHELAAAFARSGTFAALERPARQVARVEAEAGRESLDAARRAADPGRRLDALKQADNRLAATQGRLDELRRKFDELARADDDRRRLRALAERQDELARRAAELAERGDPAAREAVRQEQEKLRHETDEIVQRSPELRAEALADQARRAAELAERVRELGRRQLDESRRTADPAGRQDELKTLADAQRALEEDARRLAMHVDAPLQENGRGRLNLDPIAQAAEPIERGDVEPGRQRLEQAEAELRRLARDLDDVRNDPKALARRLARRQDELKVESLQAIRDAGEVKTDEDRARLAEKLKPLTGRQEAIAKLAAAIPADEPQQGPARDAARTTREALDALKAPRPDRLPGQQDEARNALNRLADALPDPNQRRQRAFQQLGDARRKSDEVARELERHLRETAPRPDRSPEAQAADLGQRVRPLAQKQEEVAAQLAALDVDARAEPQRDRAARRAQALADLLDAVRDAAPPPSAEPGPAAAVADWHLLGPFDRNAQPPFPVAGPVDLKAIHDARKKAHATWRPARANDRGVVNLGEIYSREDNQGAFGYAEVTSPARGKGQLVVGSDDSLTVWLNGKAVYDFGGSRAFGEDQARAEVELAEGVNRLVIRCGNGNGEWMFRVALRTPQAGEKARQLDRIAELRRAAPAAGRDAHAALNRLEQRFHNNDPVDELAAQVAAELRQAASPPPDGAGPKPADPGELRRLATALRNLDAPDAPVQHAEAVRLADRAARAAEGPAPKPEEAAKAAAEAAEALAARLADAASPREQAAALARAERGLGQPDAPRDPAAQARAQRAIGEEVARLPLDAKGEAARKVEEAAHLAETTKPEAAGALADAREQAARALDELAKARPEEKPAPTEPRPDAPPRDRARKLAERERQLAQEIQAANERVDKAPEPERRARREAELAPLLEQRRQLAESARALRAERPTDEAKRREADRARDDLRLSQRHAAEALARRDHGLAAESGRRAAEALDRLAAALPETAPAPANAGSPIDPDLGIEPAQADAARELARRERQIRERLQSLLAGRIPPQERLREQSAALGRELAELRDATRDLSPRGQWPAQAATDLLANQAPQAMTQGAEALAQGRRDAARDQQRRAADLVENAARAAEDLAAALKADRPAGPDADANAHAANPPRGEGQPDLASARAAQQHAAQQLAQSGDDAGRQASAEAASQAMHQAAQGLRAASRSSRPSPSDLAESDAEPDGEPQSTRDPKSAPAGRAAADLGELQALIRSKTGRQWGELPGHLRTEILQMSRGRYRDDYARLIQLYFREIAADGDAKP